MHRQRTPGHSNSYRYIVLISALLTFVLAGRSSVDAQDQRVVKEGAELQLIADGFAFTEGPSVDRDGNVYFTDQPNDRIMKWNESEDSVTEWMRPAGRANGTWVGPNGVLYACADDKNELWSISLDQEVSVLVSDLDGRKLNGPNDLWISPNGSIYFTDPLYIRPYWEREGESELDGQHVYRYDMETKSVTMVASEFVKPNGIIGSPDATQLYVADIGDRKTYRFDILEDGSLGDPILFCELGSDGMTIDQSGNVYLTGQGVTVFDSSGQQIDHIEVPQRWTANVCFAGRDRRTLFITASTSVYRIEMETQGVGIDQESNQ